MLIALFIYYKNRNTFSELNLPIFADQLTWKGVLNDPHDILYYFSAKIGIDFTHITYCYYWCTKLYTIFVHIYVLYLLLSFVPSIENWTMNLLVVFSFILNAEEEKYDGNKSLFLIRNESDTIQLRTCSSNQFNAAAAQYCFFVISCQF